MGDGYEPMIALTTTASCLRCEWGAFGPKADSQAEAHTKKQGHATVTTSVPLLRMPKEDGDAA